MTDFNQLMKNTYFLTLNTSAATDEIDKIDKSNSADASVEIIIKDYILKKTHFPSFSWHHFLILVATLMIWKYGVYAI